MWNEKPSLRFEIDNFSEKEAPIASNTFVSGGCRWFLYVFPKGDLILDKHMYLYLCVANHKSLGAGWKREADYSFVLLNQSNKKLHSSSRQARSVFWDWIPGWGFRTAMPLSSLQEKGFLKNDRLIIEVYVKNVEAVDGEGRYLSEMKETVELNGFQVLISQVSLARKTFAEHPDIAKDFKQKNQVLKSAYMNILLNLIEILNKPSQNHSETELADAHSELCALMKVGFKLDWLKLKLEEVSLQRKKAADGYGFRIQKLECPWVKRNPELIESKHEEVSVDEKKAQEADVLRIQQFEERIGLIESKLEEVCSKRKNANDADEYWFQNLEESVKNIEQMSSKREEVSLQRKKAYNAVRSQVQKLEERIKKFELMDLGSLKSKLEEVYLERKKADADGYRVRQLEESFKNLELMVSNLKVELDKEKENSSVDGFFLVD